MSPAASHSDSARHIWVDVQEAGKPSYQIQAIDLRSCPWAKPIVSQTAKDHPEILLPKDALGLLHRIGVIWVKQPTPYTHRSNGATIESLAEADLDQFKSNLKRPEAQKEAHLYKSSVSCVVAYKRSKLFSVREQNHTLPL